MENNEPKQETEQNEKSGNAVLGKIKENFKTSCCAAGCKNRKVILGIIIAVLVAGFAMYVKKPNSFNFGELFSRGISQEEAKSKTEEFIKNNLVQPGTEVSVKSVSEENNLYKIVVSVGEQEITSYLTKDGKKFFPQVMDIAEIEKQATAEKETEAPKEIPKSDAPVVDLYVMSFCPYGNKAEDTLQPVYALLKNKATFNFHYIVSSSGEEIKSLHGQKEVDQDEREACVLKNYGKDKWFVFVGYVNKNCGSDGACWETGAKIAGLNVDKIKGCVKTEGVALMKADEGAAKAANAGGSPTMLINGVSSKTVYQYGNSEAYKQAICDAFNTAPAECAKKLNEATSTAEGGSCGK